MQLGATVGGAVGGFPSVDGDGSEGLRALVVAVVVVIDPHLAPLVAATFGGGAAATFGGAAAPSAT